ncbi:MAG: arsenate reductase family protein [Akkermansia sp.]|nr:arsenate reductase family protein [Akkermansia sp.]
MSTQFIEYPKCSTCRKARTWLQEQGVEFSARHIVEKAPSAEELRTWWQASGLPLRRFFNTCGTKYRELNLATRLKEMSDEEMLELLATDGMLVKRPLLVTDDGSVIPGFKSEVWSAALTK